MPLKANPYRVARYAPPPDVVELDAARLGFRNGFLLRVPRLYTAGDTSLLDLPIVAIVGSRNATPEGCKRAVQLARALARGGVVVMSGLAAGIDEAAHRAAIAAAGKTIAVIGTPLEKAYPREHAGLQQEIYEKHLLISPFPRGMRIFPSHFPERNRVMARLAAATVVVEAGDTSGSLHQVVASLEVGHLVFIASSVVHDPRLTWPKRFVSERDVHILESVSDVLDRLVG